MLYSNKPLFGGNTAQSNQERTANSETGNSSTYDRQSPNMNAQRDALTFQSAEGPAGSETGNVKLEKEEPLVEQGGYSGSHKNKSENGRPAAASQGSALQQPSYLSGPPSAGWSTTSAAAGWGSSQSTGTGKNYAANESAGSTGQSLLQKAKEYLPGQGTAQTGSTAQYGTQNDTKDGSHQSPLDKAKEYMPRINSSRSTESAWQGGINQEQERDGIHDVSVGPKQAGTYSSPGAEPVAPGTASACHTDRDANYSPDRTEKLSDTTGLAYNHRLETISNSDSMTGQQSNKAGVADHYDSPSSVNHAASIARGNGACSSDLGNNSAQQGYSQTAGGRSEYSGQPRYSSVSTFGGSSGQQGYGHASSVNGDAAQHGHTQSGDLGSNSGTPRYSQASMFSKDVGQQARSQSGDLGSNSGTPRSSQTSTFGSNVGQQAHSQSGAGSSTSGTPRYSQTSAFGQQEPSQSGGFDRQSGGSGSNSGQKGYGQTSAFSATSGQQQGYSQAGGINKGQGVVAYEPVTRLPPTGIPPVFHPPSYITAEIPSYDKTIITEGGNPGSQLGVQSHSTDTAGVHAKEALQPLTGVATWGTSSDAEDVNAKQALQPLTQIPAGDSDQEADAVHAKDALQPLTEVPAQEGKGIVESIMEYLPGQQQTGAVEQEQPGFFDRAKAYVPSLHSSDPSHQTGEPLTTPQQAQYTSTFMHTQHTEAQPSLLDKAKAYIPVLGSATDFDPVTEAHMQQDDKLYQELPEGDTGFEPESSHHESLLDKAKAYMPAMGAPGTTTAGIDANTGASAGAPHKGLVEELVEKAKEYLPHQLTGVEIESSGGGYAGSGSTTDYTGSTTGGYAASNYTGSTTGGYAGSNYAGSNASHTRDVHPQIGGVRLSNRPILGPDVGPMPYSTATEHEAPHGIVDKVKQLVGLGPSTSTPADHYDYEETPSTTGLASQGLNVGALGPTSRVDSLDGDDDDIFVDAPEELESVSFTSTNTSYTQLPADTGYNQQPAGSAYTSSYRQPYVNQTGPPKVDSSNDPDDTFGPVKPRQGPAQPAAAAGPATFGDDDDYEGTGSGTPGKKGFRAKMKGKLGAKKEHHQEKKRAKANDDLDNKMHEKEISKAQAVTTPAAPEQATKAPTAGSNLGPGGGGGMMGGVVGGSPADPHGNAQSDSKQDAAPATAKPASNYKTPHEAVKANEHAGGSNIRMGSDAQQKAEEAPPRKQKSGFMSKLKKPFGKS
ncbi:hypothetical protein WJX77_004720 [Trebouxia sp. C0004]